MKKDRDGRRELGTRRGEPHCTWPYRTTPARLIIVSSNMFDYFGTKRVLYLSMNALDTRSSFQPVLSFQNCKMGCFLIKIS